MSDLARALHVSNTSVQKWAKGEITPRPGMIEKIASFFNVLPQFILYGDDASENVVEQSEQQKVVNASMERSQTAVQLVDEALKELKIQIGAKRYPLIGIVVELLAGGCSPTLIEALLPYFISLIEPLRSEGAEI